MLFIIGLGLADEHDISLRGLAAVRSCSRVFLEAYTSLLPGVDIVRLESLYGRRVELAHRETVEVDVDVVLADALENNVAFLVVGDPFGATTHVDLLLRASQKNIVVTTIHNASIISAVGCTGLQLYNFGLAISLVFFTRSWRPDSWYDKIKANRRAGMHTLCLLDIKIREQSSENLARGRSVYEPPRFMTINEAVAQLLEIEDIRRDLVYSPQTVAVGVARLGAKDQVIISGTLQQLLTAEFGGPLHSLVLPASKVHAMEKEYLRLFALDPISFDKYLDVDA